MHPDLAEPWLYRSEAFAEDLDLPPAPVEVSEPKTPRRPLMLALGVSTALALALASGAAGLFGLA